MTSDLFTFHVIRDKRVDKSNNSNYVISAALKVSCLPFSRDLTIEPLRYHLLNDEETKQALFRSDFLRSFAQASSLLPKHKINHIDIILPWVKMTTSVITFH